jgi:hypothetical protein
MADSMGTQETLHRGSQGREAPGSKNDEVSESGSVREMMLPKHPQPWQQESLNYRRPWRGWKEVKQLEVYDYDVLPIAAYNDLYDSQWEVESVTHNLGAVCSILMQDMRRLRNANG